MIAPACNERRGDAPVLDRVFESVRLPCEVLVVINTEDDFNGSCPVWPTGSG
jgi:dolichol-phosphate mannosyltransferase